MEVVAIVRKAELIIKEMFPLDSSLSFSTSIRHLYQSSAQNVACLAKLQWGIVSGSFEARSDQVWPRGWFQ